jgi:hypothetical protein
MRRARVVRYDRHMDAVPRFDVIASFDDDRRARDAAEALLRDGVVPSAVSVMRTTPSVERAESPFFVRVVLVIVWWSILGTIVGVAIGFGLWKAGIGPVGTTGIILQTISWGIFGHLIAGMWAGYALLADRSKREFAPPASEPRTIVTVRCDDRMQLDRARRALSQHGPKSVQERAG